jgi:hypothetical protein
MKKALPVIGIVAALLLLVFMVEKGCCPLHATKNQPYLTTNVVTGVVITNNPITPEKIAQGDAFHAAMAEILEAAAAGLSDGMSDD